jgi:hypothetical protein
VARSLPALGALTVLLVAAPAADAHSLVRVADGVAAYISVDEVSLNTLTVAPNGGRIEFRDPTAYQGMDIGTCDPGEVSNDGYVLQAFCPTATVSSVRVELGNREDTATVTPGVPSVLLGGDGADALTTGDTADTVDGGPGNDRIVTGAGADIAIGGAGVDDIDAGAGDDDIRVRDGLRDVVRCGDGSDRADADAFDELAADCESVSRTATAPPPESGSTATDKTAPKVDVGAITLQKLGQRGVVRVVGTSSERGTLGASGYIDIAGLRLPLGNVSRPVNVPGGGAELTLKLTKAQLREAKKMLKRKRRVTVHLSVVATDAAGNSAAKRAPRIRVSA